MNLSNEEISFLFVCLEITTARRHSKIIASGNNQHHHQQQHPSQPRKKVDYDYNEYEYQPISPQANTPVAAEAEDDGQQDLHEAYLQSKSIPHKKPGYSSGSGLRSIAQGSANQASSAVSNQHAAAKQASYVAQNTLAQAASQAAATAQAALAGKQVLLQGLEQQTVDARQALEGEIQQLHQAKRSAKAAQQSAQQAMNHVQVLTAALNNAQTASEHAQQSATEAAAELASQTAMVGTAKVRLEQIEEQLHSAR